MKALTENQKRLKRAEILKAAEYLLGSRGYAEFTMDAVASEAGFAKGTLFLYYRNKEELLLDLFSGMTRSLGEKLRREAAAESAGRETLERTVRILLEHFDKKRDITGYSGGFPLSGAAREKLRETFAENMKAIAAVLENCAKKNFLKISDPLFSASVLFGMCRGSNTYARLAGGKLPPEARAKIITGIFLNGTRKNK